MKRIRLVVAYDGTNYCGWQLQSNGNTIEAELNKALSRLTGEEIHVLGASRTDSGVHALGNIAVFNTESKIPAEKFCYALNQWLPADIVIQSSEEVPLTYHPRKCNSLKTYEYRILCRKFPDPTRRLNFYFCRYRLDTEKMREAAAYLAGEHDFSSFCSAGSQAEDTIRKIYSASVEENGDLVTIRLVGNGFLYNMVRIISGTLLEVGKGFLAPEKVKEILNARDRRQAGGTAPAEGLTLVSIEPLKLPESERNTNDWIDYTIDRSGMETEKKVTMTVRRFVPQELSRMVERTAKHAFRDGAEALFVSIPEKEGREEEALREAGTEPEDSALLLPPETAFICGQSDDFCGWKIVKSS